jgi:hypothetical protein
MCGFVRYQGSTLVALGQKGFWAFGVRKEGRKHFQKERERGKRVGCDTELHKIKHGPTAITVQCWGRHAQITLHEYSVPGPSQTTSSACLRISSLVSAFGL